MATATFTADEFKVGYAGILNTVTNPARIYGASGRTLWVGYITGTEAILTASHNSGTQDAMLEISIDGAAFAVSASRSGTSYTLYTGLTDAKRLVAIRYAAAYGTGGYIASSGNVLTVNGDAPAMEPFAHWVQLRDGDVKSIYSAMTEAAPANFEPPYVSARSTGTNGSNVAAIKIRGAFNELVAVGNTEAVYVSKNGAAPTKYSRGDAQTSAIYAFRVNGLGGDLATYYVWNAGNPSVTLAQFSVSGDVEHVDCVIKRRLDQYGDSITDGQSGGGLRGGVDTMYVAAAMGFIGSTNGVAGLTVPNCQTLIDTAVAARVISADDVAVLAIGRNNSSDMAAVATEYESCIDKLLAAGYGTVICRGIIPGASTVWTAANAVIQGIVEAKSDPRIVYVNPDGWTGIEYVDTTHPTPAGYLTLAAYALPAYIDVLGLSIVLSVNDVGLSVSSDNVALVQSNALAVNDAAMGLLADAVVLTTASSLFVSDMAATVSVDSVELVQANALGVADIGMLSSADSVELSLNALLSVADVLSSVAISEVSLDLSAVLVVGDVDVSLSADSPILIQQNALAINDIRLSILMDSLTLGGGVFVTESALGMMVRDFYYVLQVEG